MVIPSIFDRIAGILKQTAGNVQETTHPSDLHGEPQINWSPLYMDELTGGSPATATAYPMVGVMFEDLENTIIIGDVYRTIRDRQVVILTVADDLGKQWRLKDQFGNYINVPKAQFDAMITSGSFERLKLENLSGSGPINTGLKSASVPVIISKEDLNSGRLYKLRYFFKYYRAGIERADGSAVVNYVTDAQKLVTSLWVDDISGTLVNIAEIENLILSFVRQFMQKSGTRFR